MDLANVPANVMLLFVPFFLFYFDYHGISAQFVEVKSPSSLIWKERAEVTCTFQGSLLSIDWIKTEGKAQNSDNGELLLTYISGQPVQGPGLSRGMDISLSNYSLMIDNAMLQDSGYFWCKVTLRSGGGTHENSSSSIVYNETEDPVITAATECDAGIDTDFCVTEGKPITCKVFGLKPLNEDDMDLTIDGEGIQGDQSQEQYDVIEDGVSYTFYNVERTLTTGSAADEAYTYNCKITTSAFEADAPPVEVLVSKGGPVGLGGGAIAGIVICIIVVIVVIGVLVYYFVFYKKDK